MAHPSNFRTVYEAEFERLARQGWRLLDDSKALSPNAIRQRKHRVKIKEQGLRRFTAHLEPELFEEFLAHKRPEENYDDFLKRLVLLLRLI